MYLQETTTYVKDRMNQFDSMCWNRIAETEHPLGARFLGLTKAIAGFVQELLINPLEVIDEAIRVPFGDGRVVNVMRHFVEMVLSPITALVKLIVVAALILYDANHYAKTWAQNYDKEVEAFKSNIARTAGNEDNEPSLKLAEAYIQKEGYTDPLAQNVIKDVFYSYYADPRFKTHDAKQAYIETYFSGEGKALLATMITLKRENQPYKEFKKELTPILASLEESNPTKFKQEILIHEEKYQKESAKTNKEFLQDRLQEITNNQLKANLKAKFAFKQEKFDEISRAFTRKREKLIEKFNARLEIMKMDNPIKQAETNEEFKIDSPRFEMFDMNILNAKVAILRSHIIQSNTEDDIRAIIFKDQDKEKEEDFIQTILLALNIRKEEKGFNHLCAQISIQNLLHGHPGTRDGVIAYFLTGSIRDKFIEVNSKMAEICSMEKDQIQLESDEFKKQERINNFSRFIEDVASKSREEIDEMHKIYVGPVPA